jgi:hypothetical protein
MDRLAGPPRRACRTYVQGVHPDLGNLAILGSLSMEPPQARQMMCRDAAEQGVALRAPEQLQEMRGARMPAPPAGTGAAGEPVLPSWSPGTSRCLHCVWAGREGWSV